MDDIVHKVSKVAAIISGIALLIIMMVTVINVIMRLLHHTFIGAYELTTLMIIVTASFSLGYTAAEKGHVDIDAFTCKLPKHIQLIFQIITSLIGLAFVAFLCWAAVWIISIKLSIEETTDLLGIPYQPFRFIILFGLLFLFSVLLTSLVRSIRAGEMK